MAEDRLAYEVLLVGGSAGSIEVLLEILPALHTDLPFAIVIVLHRKSDVESGLSLLFSQKTGMHVSEPEEKDPIQPSRIYLAPGDYHLLIEKDKTFSLDLSERVHYSRPSIDITFETAADAYGPAIAALLLSGANIDGVDGLKKIKAAGGHVMVQDPATAEVSYMPQQALNAMKPDAVLKPSEMADYINRLAEGHS